MLPYAPVRRSVIGFFLIRPVPPHGAIRRIGAAEKARNQACQVAIPYPPLAAILPRRAVQGDYVLIRLSGHMHRPRIECRCTLAGEVMALVDGGHTKKLCRLMR